MKVSALVNYPSFHISSGTIILTDYHSHHPSTYQLTSPRIPLAFDRSGRSSAVVHYLEHHLTAGTPRGKAESARLTTRSRNRQALHTRVIGDGEIVVNAVEMVLNTTARLAVAIQNMHFGSVQTVD